MKIGITLDMSVAFWANGMQQNIVFLYSLLQNAGNECYYITYKKPEHELHKGHKGMMLQDLLKDDNEVLDVLIIAGFDLLPDMYKRLKKRNKKLKIILIHYGNKMIDDFTHAAVGPESNREPIAISSFIDEIWTSPHYGFAVNYLKTYYKNDNVKIAPYIWDSFFVDEKIEELKDKGLNPEFNQSMSNKICVFEPNKNFSKNCVIPLMICERFNQLFGNELSSINIFCCEKIRKRKFLIKYVNQLNIGKQKDLLFFNNRWGAIEACCKFGKTVLSHQTFNELNYSHFEKLHLGLPLIHNSAMLENVGYYYPEFDVDMGAKQLKNAMQNHASTINDYKKDAKTFLREFSPDSENNIKEYIDLLNND